MPKLTVAERRAALASSLASFASSWDVEGAEVGLKLDDDRCVAVRAVRNGDEPALCKFGLEGLSEASRALYGPYDWKSPDLEALFTESIEHSRSRRDLHLVLDLHLRRWRRSGRREKHAPPSNLKLALREKPGAWRRLRFVRLGRGICAAVGPPRQPLGR